MRRNSSPGPNRDLGDLSASFARGDFAPLLGWLREKIHSQGKRYRPRQLVQAVTGEDLNPAYLIKYLTKKFGELYDLRLPGSPSPSP